MMGREHVEGLRSLRDALVEDRRNLVSSMNGEAHSASESAMEFVNLQQLIDTVERAIAHEHSLDRPAEAWPSAPVNKPRPS